MNTLEQMSKMIVFITDGCGVVVAEKDAPIMTARRWACALVGFCAALAAVGLAVAKEPTVGEPAPDFEATTFDGARVSLVDFRGQVLVVNFWGTRCERCKKELPLLDFYYQAQKKAGLRVLAVDTVDWLAPRQLRRVASRLTMPLVLQFKGGYAPQKSLPTKLVIDRVGILRYAEADPWTLADMNRILVPLLREQVPPPEHEVQSRPVMAMRAAEQQLP
jgi:peroxiredoxin